jgi:hypothetical protein
MFDIDMLLSHTIAIGKAIIYLSLPQDQPVPSRILESRMWEQNLLVTARAGLPVKTRRLQREASHLGIRTLLPGQSHQWWRWIRMDQLIVAPAEHLQQLKGALMEGDVNAEVCKLLAFRRIQDWLLTSLLGQYHLSLFLSCWFRSNCLLIQLGLTIL